MAVRKRFKPAEREAFRTGVRVEWLHGSHWQPAVLTSDILKDPFDGTPYVEMVHKGNTTRTISHGAALQGYPGSIRMPVSE